MAATQAGRYINLRFQMEKVFNMLLLIARKMIFNTLLFMSFLFPAFCFAQDLFPNNPDGVTRKLFYYLSKEQFNDAANLFFYPSEYTKEELLEEKESVAKTLQSFHEKFGRALKFGPPIAAERVIALGVSGIKIEYLKRYSPFHSQIFSIDFEKQKGVSSMTGYIMNKETCMLQMVVLGAPKPNNTQTQGSGT